jgi:hypothetical protein
LRPFALVADFAAEASAGKGEFDLAHSNKPIIGINLVPIQGVTVIMRPTVRVATVDRLPRGHDAMPSRKSFYQPRP